MRLTTHNTFTDIVSIGLAIVFMGLSVAATFFMLSAGVRFIAGVVACEPSL